MREMRAEAYTKAMAEHNRAIAKHEGASLANLVRAFSATSMRRVAASIIARLLDNPGFDEEGIRWERMGPAGNVLWIDGVPSTGYENYANVQLEFDKRQMEGTLNVAQRNSTLSIKRVSFEAWRAKADELAKVGLSLSTPGFDLQTFSQERLGAAFVISYVFLMEEMQMEVDTMQREIEEGEQDQQWRRRQPVFARGLSRARTRATLRRPLDGMRTITLSRTTRLDRISHARSSANAQRATRRWVSPGLAKSTIAASAGLSPSRRRCSTVRSRLNRRSWRPPRMSAMRARLKRVR